MSRSGTDYSCTNLSPPRHIFALELFSPTLPTMYDPVKAQYGTVHTVQNMQTTLMPNGLAQTRCASTLWSVWWVLVDVIPFRGPVSYINSPVRYHQYTTKFYTLGMDLGGGTRNLESSNLRLHFKSSKISIFLVPHLTPNPSAISKIQCCIHAASYVGSMGFFAQVGILNQALLRTCSVYLNVTPLS